MTSPASGSSPAGLRGGVAGRPERARCRGAVPRSCPAQRPGAGLLDNLHGDRERSGTRVCLHRGRAGRKDDQYLALPARPRSGGYRRHRVVRAVRYAADPAVLDVRRARAGAPTWPACAPPWRRSGRSPNPRILPASQPDRICSCLSRPRDGHTSYDDPPAAADPRLWRPAVMHHHPGWAARSRKSVRPAGTTCTVDGYRAGHGRTTAARRPLCRRWRSVRWRSAPHTKWSFCWAAIRLGGVPRSACRAFAIPGAAG